MNTAEGAAAPCGASTHEPHAAHSSKCPVGPGFVRRHHVPRAFSVQRYTFCVALPTNGPRFVFPMLACDEFLRNGRHFRITGVDFLTNGSHYRQHF